MRASVFAYTLRAVGLEIVNSLYRKWSGRSKSERPKVVLHKSFWIALSRAMVHILPVSVFIVLIYINYKTLYIGPAFRWTGQQDDAFFSAIIQVAAKAQELLCVASLAAIVLQALRQELLNEGIPIGLLGSGVWFSQISSFWSPEFLAALPWSFQSARRMQLYLLLIAAGFIAAVIGPASAVMMLPRYQEVPAGCTSFYHNGVTEELWPSTVTSASELAVCTFPNSTDYPLCPSGGYKSILHTLGSLNLNQTTFCLPESPPIGQQFAPQCQAKGITGTRYWNNLLIQTSGNVLPPVLSSFSQFTTGSGLSGDTVVIQPHAATVASVQRLVRMWSSMITASATSSWVRHKWSYGLVASASATNPWVRVLCSTGQNLSIDATDAGFPYLQSTTDIPGTDFARGHRRSDISGLDRSESSHLRAQWISLDMDRFGDVDTATPTTGLFVELPWTGESRVGFGCTVVASWHNNTLTSDRSANYGAWSAVITGMEHYWRPPGLVESRISSQTNRPIELNDSWLRLLTPRLDWRSNSSRSGLETWNPNTIEDILTKMGVADIVENLRVRPTMHFNRSVNRCVYGTRYPDETDTEIWNAQDCGNGEMFGGGARPFVQLIIGSLIADGLARFGSHRVFDNVGPDLRDWSLRMPQTFNSSLLLKDLPRSSANLASQWLSISVTGLAYYASETSDYLALAVVCAYMLLATTHVLWVLYWRHRVSSGAWDTVTELLVLCKNSPPSAPSQLDNTSAGINHLSTFKTVVKVRSMDAATEEAGEENDANEDNSSKGAVGKKVILVEEHPMRSQDEMKLALLGATTCATIAAPLPHSNPRKRPERLDIVKHNCRYG